jgi:hypothetical protein
VSPRMSGSWTKSFAPRRSQGIRRRAQERLAAEVLQ